MPEFDDDSTGKLIARLTTEAADPHAPVTQGQIADIRAAVARFLVAHAQREAAEKDRREQEDKRDREARRRENYIVAAVTVGFTAVLSFAVWGFGYVQQAAADHDEVARRIRHDAEQDAAIAELRSEDEAIHQLVADQVADLMRRGYEMQGLVQRLEASVVRLEDIDRERRNR